jgi:hypothetical protein
MPNACISCGRARRPGGPAGRVLRRRRDGSDRQLHAELDGRSINSFSPVCSSPEQQTKQTTHSTQRERIDQTDFDARGENPGIPETLGIPRILGILVCSSIQPPLALRLALTSPPNASVSCGRSKLKLQPPRRPSGGRQLHAELGRESGVRSHLTGNALAYR